MKKISVLLMVLVLVTSSMNVAVFANNNGNGNGNQQPDVIYVALGDSLAAGVGATSSENRYVELFANELDKTFGNVELRDHSNSGLLISELGAQLLLDPGVTADVMAADVITISIGGNELLQPVLESMGLLVDAENPFVMLAMLEDIIGTENLEILIGMLAEAGSVYGPFGILVVFEELMNAESMDEFLQILYNVLGEENYQIVRAMFLEVINEKAAEMNGAIPEALVTIIGSIRMANQDAVIYVNNLYNPFPFNPRLAGLINPFIGIINDSIEDAVLTANSITTTMPAEVTFCYVVDVYSSFGRLANPKNPLLHHIPVEAMASMSTLMTYVSLYVAIPMAAGEELPPLFHPTDRGYKEIAKLHKTLLSASELRNLVELEPISIP